MAHKNSLLEEVSAREPASAFAGAEPIRAEAHIAEALRPAAVNGPLWNAGPPGQLPGSVATLRFFQGNVHRIVALAAAEAIVVWIAFLAAAFVRFSGEGYVSVEEALGPLWPRAAAVTAVMLAALASMGLYQLRQRARYAGVLARIAVASVSASAGLGFLFYLLPSLFVGRGVLVLTGLFSFAGLAVLRYGFTRLVDQDVFKRRILVWGAGTRAANIVNRLRRATDQRGFRVVGYVIAKGEQLQVPGHQLVSEGQDMLEFVLRERVHEVVMAMDDRRSGFPEAFLRECRVRGIGVCDIVQFLERETGRVSVEIAQPSWLIYSRGFRADLVRLAVKRAFDLAAAFALLALSFPVMLLAALAIYFEDRGPIFYRQIRTGQGGRPFHIIKFRSMSVNAESAGKAIWAVRDDPRVTRVGAFIRKVRIDELPQVFNVLAGNMSFVGPRPERPEFVRNLSQSIPFYVERHFMKPGITGWAQVRYPYGASEHDAREKLGYDLYYVANHSIVFDIMVLLQTVEIVLFRIGAR